MGHPHDRLWDFIRVFRVYDKIAVGFKKIGAKGGSVLKKYTISLFFLILLFSSAVKADNSQTDNQESKKSTSLPPIVYPMKFVYIFEGKTPEVIIVVGNGGFKSIASLKKWAQNLPSGTTLAFDMTCKRLGIEPLINSEKEMDDFKEFCTRHNINLTIRPAG